MDHLAASPIQDGRSGLISPEGRGQPFLGGAGYLALIKAIRTATLLCRLRCCLEDGVLECSSYEIQTPRSANNTYLQ